MSGAHYRVGGIGSRATDMAPAAQGLSANSDVGRGSSPLVSAAIRSMHVGGQPLTRPGACDHFVTLGVGGAATGGLGRTTDPLCESAVPASPIPPNARPRKCRRMGGDSVECHRGQ